MAEEEVRACIVGFGREVSNRFPRYNEILFMIDTCQANTMYSKFYSPNILATGSSELDEKSYSVRIPSSILHLYLTSRMSVRE